MKKPNLDHPMAVARAMTNLLRRHGFTVANRARGKKETAGFYVHRLGCTNRVALSWNYDLDAPRVGRYENAQTIAEQTKAVREFFVQRGYILDERDKLTCRFSF